MATNFGQFTLSASPTTAEYLVGYATAVSGGERRWTLADVLDLYSARTATLTNKTINGASNTITNVSLTAGITGTLAIGNGGTGATTAADARTALGLGTLATQNGTFSGTSSGTNTGDQTSIVGITGTIAQFNTALTDADFATGGGTVTGTSSGTNTGDQTISLTGDVTGSGTGSFAATLATVNSNVGSFGSATAAPVFTVNAKGLITAASSSTITPAVGSITGLGTGIATALAVNTGAAGAPVLFNGDAGTPTALVGTNITGTASGLTAGNVTTNANLTGDVTSVGNATTLATVNSNVGSFGSSTSIPSFTVNGKGLITAASGNAVVAPAGTLTGTTLASGVVTSSLTTVGALNSGSITSGFGSIDVGADSISGGAISGTTIGATGVISTTAGLNALTINNAGANQVNLLAQNTAGSLEGGVFASGVGYIGTTSADNFEIYAHNAKQATFTSTGLNSTVIGATTPAALSATTGTFSGVTSISTNDTAFRGRESGGNYRSLVKVNASNVIEIGDANNTNTVPVATDAASLSVAGTVFSGGVAITKKLYVGDSLVGAAGSFTTLSASGLITSTNSGRLFNRAGAATAEQYFQVANTGGDFFWGVNDSAAAFAGGTAYSLFRYAPTGRVIQDIIQGTAITTTSSTGLAVTGTVSATERITSTASGFSATAAGTGLTIGTATDGSTGQFVAGSATDSYLDYLGTLHVRKLTGGTADVLTLSTTGLAVTGTVSTTDPAGGAGPAWKLGVAASVSPTSPNRTIRIDIGGTSYYLHAKTTND